MTISNNTIEKTSLLALISYFSYSSRLAPNIRFNYVFLYLIVLKKGANKILSLSFDNHNYAGFPWNVNNNTVNKEGISCWGYRMFTLWWGRWNYFLLVNQRLFVAVSRRIFRSTGKETRITKNWKRSWKGKRKKKTRI